MMRSNYQFGSLYQEARKNGPDVWVYRWRESTPEGVRQLRKRIVGSILDLRTQTDAQKAVEAFRVTLNKQAAQEASRPRTIGALVEHYRSLEMPMETHDTKRRSTKLVYQSNLECHILPRWGKYELHAVRTIDVEAWLRSLKLAPASKAKIRNVLSMVFRHAIRWGWLEQNANPITLVRCSSKRLRTPSMLTTFELRALLDALPYRERLMGVICATTGLRICEVLGLKWENIHFDSGTADIVRSFVDGAVGPCKTETSQQAIPLDEVVLIGLRSWHAETAWVFPSERKFGKMPLWPDSLRTKILQPAAKQAGISKRIGWHTFRHTYSSLLAHTGNDMRVVQELMRHAKLSTTMEVYTHARSIRTPEWIKSGTLSSARWIIYWIVLKRT
jgi:integrase